MKNFAVKVNGKEYWISRSVAICAMVYKEKSDGLYVLLEKRGKGAADNIGKYCLICGYLDYNESLEQATCRESHEECGFEIDADKLKFVNINSSPSENHQNVTVHYAYKADEDEDFDLNKATGGEKDEVESVKWFKIGTFKNDKLLINPYKLMEMDFAFEHDRCIIGYLSLNYTIDYGEEEKKS